MSERWRKVGEFRNELSLAVGLTDAVTGGQPVGDVDVTITGVDEQPVRNRSGYYLFFDLPAEERTVTVDGGEQYQNASTLVELDPSSHDPGEATELTLEPTTAYQFPAGVTRVRGTVFEKQPNGDLVPVPGADVSVVGHTRTVRTNDAGEFVYYFDVENVDVVHADTDNDSTTPKVRVYRPGGSDPEFTFDPDPSDSQSGFSDSFPVEVGRLTTHDLVYEP